MLQRPLLALLPALLLLLSTGCGGEEAAESQRPTGGERTYLAAAQQAAQWIGAHTVDTPHGPIWPADVFKPEAVSTRLGDGVAGTVAFFLKLHRATGDDRHLDEARRGADYLLATLPDVLSTDGYHPAATLYGTVPGAGFALHEVYKATGAAAYGEGARRCVDWFLAYAGRQADDAGWPPANDVLNGNAGTGLFLLYAAREMDLPAARDLALRLGRLLLDRAIPDHGGATWKMREDRDFVLPNFSHGAAGIGYFLASLYEATGEAAFLDAARAAARYLEAVARTNADAFLVPYGWPNPEWDGYYDVGWAHGPAGTARLFYRLWQITGEAAWLDRVHACARGIRQSGLPGTPNPGFGDEPFKPDLRFGIAGVALFFLDLYRETGEPSDLAFARRLTDTLLDRTTTDAEGLRWEAPRYDFFEHPGDSAAFTGYFYGAAGYGLLLLRLDAAERDTTHKIAFPDDPFGSAVADEPLARNQPTMVYDAARNQVVLFGGWDGTYLGDTWTWDGAGWTPAGTTGPSARDGKPGLAYDRQRQTLVLYGGGNDNPALQDIWQWDGAAWRLHQDDVLADGSHPTE